MLTEFPPAYHSGEDIHEHCEIDEVSFESGEVVLEALSGESSQAELCRRTP